MRRGEKATVKAKFRVGDRVITKYFEDVDELDVFTREVKGFELISCQISPYGF